MLLQVMESSSCIKEYSPVSSLSMTVVERLWFMIVSLDFARVTRLLLVKSRRKPSKRFSEFRERRVPAKVFTQFRFQLQLPLISKFCKNRSVLDGSGGVHKGVRHLRCREKP